MAGSGLDGSNEGSISSSAHPAIAAKIGHPPSRLIFIKKDIVNNTVFLPTE
jgi:hypothetical protein